MKIYDKQKRLVLEVEVDDNSYRNRQIMGDNTLTLYYSLPEHVEIPVGAFCEFQNETYTLMRPEHFKMQHTRLFEYTVTFEGEYAKAKIWKFRNPVDGRLKFPLTAKPSEHLKMFVDNMNRRDTGWTVGNCISDTEKLINYDHDYNIDALAKMAQEFETEYEIIGKRVSLHKVEHDKNYPLPLSYGRGKGFKPGVGRSNSGEQPPVEILFVQGGDRNIDRSKYGAGELHLPKNQTIGYDGKCFEDEDGYNPDNARHYMVDDLGLSIRNIDRQPSTLAEDSLDRTEDYPKRVGTISEVVTVDKDKNFYDFIDNTIESTLNYEDCLIEGETMSVIFQSGELAGREFDVKYYHEAKTVKGVQKKARRFEIVPQEIDGIMMPGDSFIPRAGNTYAVFGCQLPSDYICDNAHKKGAEWDMFKAAVKYLFDNEEQKFSFSGELDGLWAKKDWINIGGKIRLGGFVRFTSEQFQREGVLVRITGVKDYINNPHSPKIDLSNETVSAGFTSSIKTLEAQEVAIAEGKREALQFTKRRFRDAKETAEMLQAAFSDNFTNAISPVTVETMQLLVGDERLQFRFINNPNEMKTVPHNVTWNAADRQLIAPAGLLQHMTLGIDSLRPNHEPNEYRFYSVDKFTSGILTDGEVKYYLYIRVPDSDQPGAVQHGQFFLESRAHYFHEGQFYWLLYGILNSEYDGERSFATLYGFTEILPGRITTDRIVSSDGSGYFDMAANAMKLGSVFDFNSQGDGKLRLRGTLVQSEGGTESHIGCYRGEYKNNYMYYNGDEVSFVYNDMTSTYRYIYPTPSKGHAPTETVYWQVIAAGSKGADGNSIKIKGTCHGHVAKANDLPSAPFSLISLYYLVDESRDVKRFSGKRWSSVITNDGDGYIMQDTGHLWVLGENGWNDVGVIRGDKGDKGDDGSPGQYTELRFAKNGSTTKPPSLNNTVLNPSGWSTTYPKVNKGYYLWMTRAVKTGNGAALVSQWTEPARLTPYDGTDGKDGKSPVMVFRGNYLPTATYYGNENRLDCVKYGDTYYIARIDAGAFNNIVPPTTSKWNDFGASFESVATNLLLAEGANIGDWFISGGKIVSTLENGSRIELDARSKRIYVYSAQSNATYQSEPLSDVHIDINANKGTVETRAADKVAYLSPTGIFANRAATVCADPSSGMSHTASVVGLGFANANKKEYNDDDEEVVAGVYGRAYNRGTAPSYGGFFSELRVNGLFLKQVRVVKSGEYLRDTQSIVIGIGSSQCNVFLPSSMRLGQTIFFKQWWTGSMRIFPIGGQKIYDDHTVNDYYDVGEGQMLIATFSKAFINGGEVEAWLVSKFKF